MSLVDQLMGAIATFEGYFKAGSTAQRNSNPGNLRSWGNLPTRDGYVVFPTAEAGWTALKRQVELNVSRGLTLQEFFAGKPGVYAGYAPANGNKPWQYAAYVAGQVGIAGDVPLSWLTDGSALPALSVAEFETVDPVVLGAVALAGVSLLIWVFG